MYVIVQEISKVLNTGKCVTYVVTCIHVWIDCDLYKRRRQINKGS